MFIAYATQAKRQREVPNMSAEDWLQAAKTEEERLLAEIAKTTLYKQLEAVRAVLAVYEGTIGASEAEQAVPSPAPRTNGAASPRSFKTANAFSAPADPGADSSSRPRPQ
jgi:hypothetical protein